MAIAMAGLLVISLMVSGVAAADRHEDRSALESEAEGTLTTVVGVALRPPTTLKEKWSSALNRLDDISPRDVPTTVFRLRRDGKDYVVATDGGAKPGKYEITGEKFKAQNFEFLPGDLIVETDRVHQDTAEVVALDKLRSNPEQYYYDVVAVKADYTNVGYNVETSAAVRYQTVGVLANDSTLIRDTVNSPIGKSGRQSVVNLSRLDGFDRVSRSLDEIDESIGEAFVTTSRRKSYWDHEAARYSVVVLPPGETRPKTSPVELHMIQKTGYSVSVPIRLDPDGSQTDSPYSFKTKYTGARISPKESLLAAAKCAPDSVTVPTSPPVCVPVVTDVRMDVGVIWGTDDRGNEYTYPAVGISNHNQEVPLKELSGVYDVQGNFVPTSDVFNSPLPIDYVFVIEQMDRRADLKSDPGLKVSALYERVRNLTTESIQYGQERSPIEEIAGDDGIVDTDELQSAIQQWATDEISTSLLQKVIRAWASGQPVSEVTAFPEKVPN